MRRFSSPPPLILSLAILAAALPLSKIYGAAYGVNLIVNGNAEAGANSSSGAAVAIPNWTVGGPMSVVPVRPKQ